MEKQNKIEKWNCVDCQRNVICKPDTLPLLGWQSHDHGLICPVCQEKEIDDSVALMTVRYDPAKGMSFHWRANRKFFKYDDELFKEISNDLQNYLLKLMKNKGLLTPHSLH